MEATGSLYLEPNQVNTRPSKKTREPTCASQRHTRMCTVRLRACELQQKVRFSRYHKLRRRSCPPGGQLPLLRIFPMVVPTLQPSTSPTPVPVIARTSLPAAAPTATAIPTRTPTAVPTVRPTATAVPTAVEAKTSVSQTATPMATAQPSVRNAEDSEVPINPLVLLLIAALVGIASIALVIRIRRRRA